MWGWNSLWKKAMGYSRVFCLKLCLLESQAALSFESSLRMKEHWLVFNKVQSAEPPQLA